MIDCRSQFANASNFLLFFSSRPTQDRGLQHSRRRHRCDERRRPRLGKRHRDRQEGRRQQRRHRQEVNDANDVGKLSTFTLRSELF